LKKATLNTLKKLFELKPQKEKVASSCCQSVFFILVYLSAENGLGTNFKGFSKSMQLDDDFVTKNFKKLVQQKKMKNSKCPAWIYELQRAT
jgi:hypothetical protein